MYKINKKFLLRVFLIGSIIFIINIFFYQLCIVDGESMLPTLKEGNIILIKKYNLKFKHNDVVVIKKKDKTIIKRLIGLPRDKIKIDEYVYVNGKKNDDLYIKNSGEIRNEITLKDEEYFVLGDNRETSIDSRFNDIGIIKEDEIIGIVIGKKGEFKCKH